MANVTAFSRLGFSVPSTPLGLGLFSADVGKTTSPPLPFSLLNNKSFAASVTLPGDGLLFFLYSLGSLTGDSKSSVSEAAHTARERIFSGRV